MKFSVLLAATLLTGGSAAGDTKNGDASVILIFQDGLPAFVFQKLISNGQLPNIQRYLIERGCQVRKTVSAFPTVTFPAHLSAVTGLFPGHSSIPGLKWMNRERQSVRHYLSFDFYKFEDDMALYSPKMAAIPHMMETPETPFSRLRGESTASVQQVLSKGASITKFFHLELALSKIMARHPHQTDIAVFSYLNELYAQDQSPRFTFVNLPDYDAIAHLEGVESTTALETVSRTDRMFGELIEVLKSKGKMDSTYFIFTSDHGNTAVRKSNITNYKEVLRRTGLKCRLRNESEFDAYVAANSLNSVAIYLNEPGTSWTNRPAHATLRDFPVKNGRRLDILEHLAEQEGTDFVIAADGPGQVRVVSRDSELLITRRLFLGSEFYRAQLLRGIVDPFRFMQYPTLKRMMASGEFHSGSEWLRLTANTRYPDALVQSVQIFDSFRCGDVFLCMRDGWKCKPSRYIATHGSMIDTDSLVPLVIAGPGIEKRTIDVARLVDVYPTMLRLLGLEIPFGVLDGRPLDEIVPDHLQGLEDPYLADRTDLLPAMRALWRVEASSPQSPILPHKFADGLEEMPKGKRLKLARLLRKRRRRLSDYMAHVEKIVPRDGLSHEVLKARELETDRQLKLLEE